VLKSAQVVLSVTDRFTVIQLQNHYLAQGLTLKSCLELSGENLSFNFFDLADCGGLTQAMVQLQTAA
jgi:hypothetical protein